MGRFILCCCITPAILMPFYVMAAGNNLFLEGGEISYFENNSTQYTLFGSIKEKGRITFLDTFHSGWSIYLDPYQQEECAHQSIYRNNFPSYTEIYTQYVVKSRDTLEQILATHTGVLMDKLIQVNSGLLENDLYVAQEINLPISSLQENSSVSKKCSSVIGLFPYQGIKRIFDTTIFDDTHKLVYNYANQWTIDPEYIRSHYSREYYDINPDGSMNVRMTIYFRPQAYFYLGLIISGLTLFGCISYLVVSGMHRRRKRGEQKIDFPGRKI